MSQQKKKASELKREHLKKHYKVSIFGSARLKPGDKSYDEAKKLGKQLAELEFDVITGGGPGIMEAANSGHFDGDPDKSADSFGITIELPFEASGNKFIEVKKHFTKFSDRLDQFVELSNAVIIMEGGIGTTLELFYIWQLTQVKHICKIPIILHGKMWENLLQWVKSNQVKKGLVSPEDLSNVIVVKSNKEALKILKENEAKYIENGLDYDINYQRYNSKEKAFDVDNDDLPCCLN